jgi:hypothetical protein
LSLVEQLLVGLLSAGLLSAEGLLVGVLWAVQ